MYTVFLITDPVITFQDLFHRIRDRWPNTYSIHTDRLGLQDGECNLFIDRYEDADAEYEPEILDKLRKLIPAPNFYAISFSLTHTNGGELVRRFLMTLADDDKIIVDNDCGLLMRGPALVRRLNTDPSWEWFNDKGGTEENL